MKQPHAVWKTGLFLLCAAALLWPAIENGSPLATTDTARHMGLDIVSPAHPYGYNLWLIPLHAWGSAWAVVGAQAALVVAMLWLALGCVAGTRSMRSRISSAAIVAGLTSAPFFASMLLPGAFTAIGLMAIALTPCSQKGALRLGLAALVFFAACVHYAHAPVFAGAWAAGALSQWRWDKAGLRRWAASGGAILAAVITLVAANWLLFDRITYSIAGPTFALARLQEDGPAVDYLREQCPNQQLRLCAELHRMPMPHVEFLWTDASPVARLGGFAALSEESERVLRGTAWSRPGEVLHTVAGNVGQQLQSFVYFPGAGELRESWFWEIAARRPRFEQGIRRSQQLKGGLSKPWLGNLQFGAVIASVLLLAPLGWLCLRRGEPRAVVFAVTLAAGIFCNAAVAGGLSAPDPRYGARTAWLAPAAAALLTAAWLRRRASTS